MRFKTIKHYALAVALMLIASLCFAKTVPIPNHPYQIAAPAGWELIPAADIDALNEMAPPQSSVAFDLGLRAKGTENSGYPYVLVQVYPPARTRLSGLPTTKQFQSLVDRFSRVLAAPNELKRKLESVKDTEIRGIAGSFMDGLSKSGIRVDAAHRRFAALVSNVNVRGKPVTAIAAWIFLPDGALVQFNCYSWSAEFAKNRADFDSIVASLQSTVELDQ